MLPIISVELLSQEALCFWFGGSWCLVSGGFCIRMRGGQPCCGFWVLAVEKQCGRADTGEGGPPRDVSPGLCHSLLCSSVSHWSLSFSFMKYNLRIIIHSLPTYVTGLLRSPCWTVYVKKQANDIACYIWANYSIIILMVIIMIFKWLVF